MKTKFIPGAKVRPAGWKLPDDATLDAYIEDREVLRAHQNMVEKITDEFRLFVDNDESEYVWFHSVLSASHWTVQQKIGFVSAWFTTRYPQYEWVDYKKIVLHTLKEDYS